jgi:predicted flap endonuclease-1-like 5' DNA nuclease
MLWLIWQMWFFLIVAFLIGLATGWRLWSASGDAGKTLQNARDEIDRLQRENDSLSSAAARHQAAFEATRKPAAADAKKIAVASTPKPARASSSPKVSKPDVRKSASDNLTDIKGLGPKAAAVLNAEGITSFAQIAAWTESDIASWDQKLTARGRIVRENWAGQAKDMLS